jgi:predicted Rossmann fold flavoprotein
LQAHKKKYSAVFIGAGAAGIFAANRYAALSSGGSILVLERSQDPLSKLKISGGGRCNVTNSCFDIRELAKNYPRGHRELIGPFSVFQPSDMIEWLRSRGVELKTEEGGRVFPVTDSSQTIIDCLLDEANDLGVSINYNSSVKEIKHEKDGGFFIRLQDGEVLCAEAIMLATGSGGDGYRLAASLGHRVITPIPSLFTFNIPKFSLRDLSGVSVEDVVISLPKLKIKQRGPLLITHWGFSGPAALKLSAWGARDLHDMSYLTTCVIDWIPEVSEKKLRILLEEKSVCCPKKSLSNSPIVNSIPKKLWETLLSLSGVDIALRWNDVSKKAKERILQRLKYDSHRISGKTVFKQEFVTCGGVDLSEVNFKSMESKKVPGLFFGGEILDIDGITGGFNFQAAWTTGYIAGSAMSSAGDSL